MNKNKRIILISAGILVVFLIVIAIYAVVFNGDLTVKGILRIDKGDSAIEKIQFDTSSSNYMKFDSKNKEYHLSHDLKVSDGKDLNMGGTLKKTGGDLIIHANGNFTIVLPTPVP